MLSKEVLRRLSELNRQPSSVAAKSRLQAYREQQQQQRSATAASHETANASRQSLASKVRWAGDKAPVARADVPQSGQLPEGRVIDTPVGAHFIIERPLDELWSGAERWLQKLHDQQRQQQSKGDDETATKAMDAPTPAPRSPLEQMRLALPDTVMFLDLETCGFSGSMVFLAGVLVAGPKGMTLVQLLARHYGEERAMIHTLWQIAAQQQVLATFNGKSFDWPVVRDRSTLHHIEQQGPLAQQDAPHCDLLHLSRRRWRKQLPNCKLQTLERYICGRHRTGDIPGHEIPNAYHQFVRSGDAWEMRNVLHHNALDLVTLFQLSLALLVEEQGA